MIQASGLPGLAHATVADTATPDPAPALAIAWQPWGPEAFAHAARHNKLVFIDVGIEGCTACRRMAEITLTDPRVIARLNEHFVAISVDAEARPDIGDRYGDWAWPALIFLAPDATQVLALRGNRLPGNFIPVLDELIDKHASGALTADGLAPLAAPAVPVASELEPLRRQVRAQLDGQLNETMGSWRKNGIGSTSGPRQQHLLMRAHMFGNQQLQALALKTADGFLKLLDPVWGGVYQAYIQPANGESLVIPEKRILGQAGALLVFASAYQLTGDVRYRNGMRKVDAYLQEWMASPAGTYYTSQEDAAPRLTERVGVRGYWAFETEHERRQFGIPPIDHAVYTDKNAQVILGYLRAFEVTREIDYLRNAATAAQSLLDERLTKDGWFLQSAESIRVDQDRRMREHDVAPRIYLSAQAWFGRALLGMYAATGESRWLDNALRVAAALRDKLEDTELGGFYDSDSVAGSAPLARRKPLEMNATAGHFFYDLGIYAKREDYQSLAERIVRATATPPAVRREGKVTAELGLLLEKLAGAYVEFSIVGESSDPRAKALFEASGAAYHPRKLVHYEAPGRYPDRGRPALYICNPDYCTLPIEDPRKVSAQLERFRAPAAS
ncbi:MAG: DUF255 domain-containing protein [Gammaproteobacteria bacterium]|nr:DUF255 domain-containing protein [Gammaproteobacteria bacterium]